MVSFITSLYCLAEHCGYGMLHDETIRDRIVVGLWDCENVSNGLQYVLAQSTKIKARIEQYVTPYFWPNCQSLLR